MFSLATPTSITFDQMNLISVWSCCFCHDWKIFKTFAKMDPEIKFNELRRKKNNHDKGESAFFLLWTIALQFLPVLFEFKTCCFWKANLGSFDDVKFWCVLIWSHWSWSTWVHCVSIGIVKMRGWCLSSSVTRKKFANVYKSCPKMISLEKWYIWHQHKNCLRMWEIWSF